MRRIKLVLAALAVMVAAFVAVSGPAMADDFTRCRDLNGPFVRCNGDLFERANRDDDIFFVQPIFVSPFVDDGLFFNNSCPFWGDFEGPVNQWDCFD